jgi:integrase
MSLPSTSSRNGRFHLRIRIPEDLRPYFGKIEIHRSPRVSDRRQAVAMVHALRGKAEAAFASLRSGKIAGLPEATLAADAAQFYAEGLPVTRRRHVRGTRNNAPRTLSEVVAAFQAERAGAWEPKTRLLHGAALTLFRDIVGEKPLGAITRADCRNARDAIARLPPNMTKRFPGESIEAVLARRISSMSPKNANRILSAVTAMFSWASREGLIPDNPARGLRLPVGSRPDLERDAFTPAELQMLFAQLGPSIGAQYWLPLVALYSGMRLEEIAQLRPADIREVQGIWVFDVNATGGKRLKTASSARLVPIHPRLLGILGLREGSSLWPSLTRGADGYWSSPFSKWFGRFKRRAGISSRRLTFHSLRHTFINELKQRGVDELTIRELVGHANPSITTGRYGKRLEPQRLAAAIQPLDFGVG